MHTVVEHDLVLQKVDRGALPVVSLRLDPSEAFEVVYTAEDAPPLAPPPVVALEGHKNAVSALAFSPDGTLLVTGSDQGLPIVRRCQEGSRLPRREEDQGGLRRDHEGSSDGSQKLPRPSRPRAPPPRRQSLHYCLTSFTM